MNSLLILLISGQVFWLGLLLLLTGAILSFWTEKRRPRRLVQLLLPPGLLLSLASAVPVPWWCYALLSAATVWLLAALFRPKLLPAAARAVLSGVVLLTAAMERPHCFNPEPLR